MKLFSNICMFKLRKLIVHIPFLFQPLITSSPSIDELQRLVIAKISDQWFAVGIGLGLSVSELQALQQEHLHDVQKCFVHVVEKWRRRSDPPFTWNTLLNVLRSDALQEIALADTIEETLK